MARTSIRTGFSRLVSYVIDESPLWRWIVTFFAIILLFGLGFACLTPYGHGMTPSIPDESSIDLLLRGLYFSVVTVSSLGYGDLHPIGFGKVLAGVEVVLGLGVIGIVIAKLTSKRVSHFVSRLFVSETKRQLQIFNTTFDNCRAELSSLLEQVSREYQQTPGSSESEKVGNSVVERSLGTALDSLLESSNELHDYIKTEGSDRSYFILAPSSSLTQLSEAVYEALFFLGQSIVNLPVKSNPSVLIEVLTPANRRKIYRIMNLLTVTCDSIASAQKIDTSVPEAFEQVVRLCTNISQALLPVVEQPDQIFDTAR